MAHQPAGVLGEVRRLFLGALGIFLVTVVIGLLNGLDLVTFERPTLLTHVHAGTLGWITLSLLAASVLLFGRRWRRPCLRRLAGARS